MKKYNISEWYQWLEELQRKLKDLRELKRNKGIFDMNSLLKQFGDIQVLFESNNRIQIREEDFLKYPDILNLLKVRGYIVVINTSTLSGTSL